DLHHHAESVVRRRRRSDRVAAHLQRALGVGTAANGHELSGAELDFLGLDQRERVLVRVVGELANLDEPCLADACHDWYAPPRMIRKSFAVCLLLVSCSQKSTPAPTAAAPPGGLPPLDQEAPSMPTSHPDMGGLPAGHPQLPAGHPSVGGSDDPTENFDP